MKKLLIAAAVSLAAIAGLSGCGGGGDTSTFTTPGIQSAANATGAELTITLAEYSENINYVAEQNGANIPKIESLGVWDTLKQDTDQGGALTYRITEFDSETSTPSFMAAVYDSNGLIKETRTEWSSSNALAAPDTFREYAIAQIMASTGLDQGVAGIMYDTVKAAPYTNGSSNTLTYACNGNYRCYYLVSGAYDMLVVEPFTDAVRTEDLKDASIKYFAVTAAGATEMQHQTSADKAAAENASSSSSDKSSSSSSSDTSNDEEEEESGIPDDIPEEAYAYDEYGWYDIYGNYTEW